jgi:hypothetical protein
MRPMHEHQENFLRDEFFSLTLMATVQRLTFTCPILMLTRSGSFRGRFVRR